jgi:hypothetical protein
VKQGGESEEVKVDRISSFVVTFVVLHRLTGDHAAGARVFLHSGE